MRRNFGEGFEVASGDLNKVSSTLERQLYDRYLRQVIQGKTEGFFDNSLLVEYATAQSVTVRAGVGIQLDESVTSPEPTTRIIYHAAQVTKSLSTPDGANDRIDLICVKADRADGDTESRKFKNATTQAISDEDMVLSTDWEADVTVVEGTPAASPVAPSVPSGYIKIATLDVTAVTGMGGAGNVTDDRVLLPIGPNILINTTGYNRVTAGSETKLSQLVADIDALLKNGDFEYLDLEELGGFPSNPASGKQRFFYYNGVLYTRNSSGSNTPVGSGGGGGGALNWNPVAGAAPYSQEENSDQVFLFEQGLTQELVALIKVPDSYIAGRQIKFKGGFYSPASSNEFQFQIVSTLVRKNVDAVSSTSNQETNATGDVTNTVADQYRDLEIDLTDADGEINSFDVSPGDLIKLELTRIAPDDGTEDTEDVRFIPNTTELKFS